MRYIRAFEVGQAPMSAKYDLAVRFRTLKNGPTVRNRLRLPHPVNTSLRIAVICPPDSSAAASAKLAGASLVGEDTIFDAVKAGRIEFDRCICHPDSTQKMQKAGLGKVLGPRGLMPSTKLGTVAKDVAGSVRNMAGGSEYREKLGVVRMAIGQLGFTPEEMQRNVRTFMQEILKDLGTLSDRVNKEIHEVVLSSTHSPGFSLNGEFKSEKSLPTKELSVL
ncbi:MAG: mitochondrial 54S ribosomal protein mrpl1 [Heterodermia speciosa]|uniref:Mitochondrial 54S ribosomal protein mrpl1 n=1 Tax=Heterodermia speciosa TaxID=116794 RepID=A0A8H3PFA4_9LECA|nr:MAG: mitochondrial 54S ribosomal protein mrpl1 [Heterodermia speciosa]